MASKVSGIERLYTVVPLLSVCMVVMVTLHTAIYYVHVVSAMIPHMSILEQYVYYYQEHIVHSWICECIIRVHGLPVVPNVIKQYHL